MSRGLDIAAIGAAVAGIEQSLLSSLQYQQQAARGERRAGYDLGLAWLEQFIMQPHGQLGRKGAVCPFAQPSHESMALYFGELDATGLSLDSFVQVVLQLPALFERTLHHHALAREQFSLAVFIDGLSTSQYPVFVDMVHALVKPVFMDLGLMLGEFQPNSRVAGIHNPDFRPMQCARPVLVTRAMSLHDRLFIDHQSARPVIRLHELECYSKWMGDKLSASQKAHIVSRIDALRVAI